MRKKKALINIVFSLLLELVTIAAGFIVPRLFIGSFGSEVNGLVNSITSFVAYITLLQTGVGSVVKASLYKPLAEKNQEELCVIIKTSSNFFKKIAFATMAYIAILMCLFPFIIAKEFGFIYTASLVVIIGVSTVAQYFFGITYQMLLEADQKSYIFSLIQIVSIIINTIVVVVLIICGFNVQIVKLASAVVFVARPIFLSAYVKAKYKINTNVSVNYDLISQRWDGFTQGIAYFIHSKTDVFVLTVFATLSEVSIYSVYALVTTGLSALVNSIDKAVRSAFGNIIAVNERENLIKSFNAYNTLVHILSVSCFGTAAITIFNFIDVYVKNVQDANYTQYAFGICIISAELMYCLRSPYNSIVYAAGKFKETKLSAGIEAVVNIVISCTLVNICGLIGVAIGTLIAMTYRTMSFIKYLHKEVIMFSFQSQIKRYIISIFSYVFVIVLFSKVKVNTVGYVQWFIYAFAVFALVSMATLLINLIFDKKNTVNSVKMLIRKK